MKPKTKFTKSDLVSGMIVITRDMQAYRVFVNYRKQYSGFLAIMTLEGNLYFSFYNHNLTIQSMREKRAKDIVSIYEPTSLSALTSTDLSKYALVAEINTDNRTSLGEYSGDELITEIANRGIKIEITKDEIEVKTVK